MDLSKVLDRIGAAACAGAVVALLMTASGTAAAAGGSKGPAGPTGPTGPQGVTGATGPAGGPPGPTGPTGANGSNGANGVTGATGPTGAAGSNGTNGSNGTTGPSGAPGSNGFTGSNNPVNGSNGATGATGATGPTGPTGPAGSNGSVIAGTVVRTCTSVGISPEDRITCTLNAKVTEQGTWSASISVPTGGPQQQASGVVSFNPKYPIEPATLKVKYKNEAESQVPALPCVGSPNEPVAQKGNLCVLRGLQKGKEAEDKNITEPAAIPLPWGTFSTPNGEFIKNNEECNKENGQCQNGVLVVFRTAQFAEPRVKVTAESYLNASGSWAVTAN
jgi:hypothetical protein